MFNNFSDRTAYVPPGNFYFSALNVSYLHSVTIEIDGSLIAHSNITEWPMDTNGKHLDEIKISYSENISLIGKGKIDGQGYLWWWYAISTALPNCDHGDTRGKFY